MISCSRKGGGSDDAHTAGNTTTESRTVYRDTTPPDVVAWNYGRLPIVPGRLTLSVTLYDPIAGVDTSVNPTVTLELPGGEQRPGVCTPRWNTARRRCAEEPPRGSRARQRYR